MFDEGDFFVDFVPARNEVGVVKEQDASFGGFVVLVRLFAAIVDGEFFEVGEDGERQLCRPGVAAELKGRADVGFDIDGRFFGFDKEFARAADAEAVVGSPGRFLDDERVFVDHVAVGFGVALAVGHVPTEHFEEGVEKVAAEKRFVVAGAMIRFAVLCEFFDERANGGWGVGFGA